MKKVKKVEKKKRSLEEKKALNWKVAEIIWYSIGGIISLAGVVFSVLGLFVLNMSGNFEKHPFYPLYTAQNDFFKWMNMDFNFASFGLLLLICGLIYFLIVIAIFARRADVIDKKGKQKKLREKNLKLFLDDEEKEQSIG